MVYGIEQAARGPATSSASPACRSLDRRSVLEAVSRLREQAVEGIIAIVPKDAAVAALAEVPADIPLVGVGLGESTDVPMVGVDNVGRRGRATVQHLLDLGHTARCTTSPARPAGRRRGSAAPAGADVLDDAGAPMPALLVGDWSARSGYEAGQRLAARSETVTAIFCANDHMALGVRCGRSSEAGRRVPAEVSVVGFDDIPEAPF